MMLNIKSASLNASGSFVATKSFGTGRQRLWQSIIFCVRNDVRRLAEKFPNDDSKKLSLEERLDSFTLTKNTYPTVSVEACWREKSSAVHLVRTTRRAVHLSGATTHGLISFTLNDQDDVQMIFGGTVYLAPEDISRGLLMSIIS
jgi:hypothetical protein